MLEMESIVRDRQNLTIQSYKDGSSGLFVTWNLIQTQSRQNNDFQLLVAMTATTPPLATTVTTATPRLASPSAPCSAMEMLKILTNGPANLESASSVSTKMDVSYEVEMQTK